MTDHDDEDASAEIVDPRADDDIAVEHDASLAARVDHEAEKCLQRGDDVEIAELIVKQMLLDSPWVHSAEAFWKYETESGSWQAREDEIVRAMAMQYAGAAVFYKKHGDRVETRALKMNNGRVEGVVRCVQTILHEKEFFDAAPAGIAFQNGFVSVDASGQIKVEVHRPEHRSRFCLPYFYSETQTPKWREFLRDIFVGDDDMMAKIECIREFVGLCLIGRITPFEKSLILYGAGSNGKSVLLSTVLDIFPPRSRSSVAPQTWAEDYHLARLDGSAINVVSELPQREILESQSLKQVISGDMVTARRPRENPFDFRPRAGHIFASNPPLPQVSDFSPGFWRRWTLISFNRRFEESAAAAKEKLIAELVKEIPGIVYWCIEGAARAIRAGKLCAVPSSSSALDRWRKSSDQIATFIEEECERTDEKLQYGVDEIYRGYRTWCGRSGHKTIGRTRFRERAEAAGVALSQDPQGRWFMRLKCRIGGSED